MLPLLVGFLSQRWVKTSLYTIFFVSDFFSVSSLMMRNFRPFLLVTLDTATYNFPWLKKGFGKYTPTCFNDCPWLLFIVIAKHTEIGNCHLFKMNGHFESLGDNVILGMNTCLPILVPVMISASITHVANHVIMSLVPLQRPSFWFKF